MSRGKEGRTSSMQMAFMLTSGGELVRWREGLREVKPGMTTGLLRWYRDQLDRLSSARGFNVAAALDVAMRLSQGTLPIFLMCGTLQPEASVMSGGCTGDSGDATEEIIKQISAAQQEVAAKRLRCPFHLHLQHVPCIHCLFCCLSPTIAATE